MKSSSNVVSCSLFARKRDRQDLEVTEDLLGDALEGGVPRMLLQRLWSQSLNPQPSTLNLKLSTLNPKPSTLNPKPQTLNSKP